MTKQAIMHRLRHHHPRLRLLVLKRMLYGSKFYLVEMKPRCTFAELGKNCPVIATTNLNGDDDE